jgi:hypothetical protein
MILFRNFGVNRAEGGQFGGIAGAAAYRSMPPHNAADFLELAKNCTFLDRKLFSALYETADGHYLNIPSFRNAAGRDASPSKM